MKKHSGFFITFEGIDGCGKTTQAKRLFGSLRLQNFPVEYVREPGGTVVSEKIRKILLDRQNTINPVSELLLYEAARAQVADAVILPALHGGRVVVCDRYFDSTTAYQGYGRGLDLDLIERLNKAASFGVDPNLTFIFDVDYATSLTRRGGQPDRLEKEKKAFFDRVRKGFLALGGKRRVIILDGQKNIDELAVTVREQCLRRLKRRKIIGA